MSALDLSGVRSKFDWAYAHFQVVDREIINWLSRDGHRVLHEFNEDYTQHYLQASLAGEPPDVLRWSLLVGDSVTNLRDVLDHLIYAVAQLSTSPKPEKKSKAAFVIAGSPEKFAENARAKLCSVPKAVYKVVEDFQHYNKPASNLPPLLPVLAELANNSKHKLLNVVMSTPSITAFAFVTDSGLRQPATIGVNRLSIVDGATIAVFQVPQPDPRIRLEHANIALEVAIQHAPRIGDESFEADRTSYRLLLQALFDEVELIIKAVVAAAADDGAAL